MARKPNYDYEKRRKEMDRKAKKDAKREDRLRRKSEGSGADEIELQRFDEFGRPIDEPGDDGAALPDDSSERG